MRVFGLQFNMANVWGLPLIIGTAASFRSRRSPSGPSASHTHGGSVGSIPWPSEPHSTWTATAHDGTVVFFSMAATLTGAALGGEGVASTARLLVGNGYAPDRGSYALELLRRDERLLTYFARSGR